MHHVIVGVDHLRSKHRMFFFVEDAEMKKGEIDALSPPKRPKTSTLDTSDSSGTHIDINNARIGYKVEHTKWGPTLTPER